MRNHTTCEHCILDLDLDNECATRTCSLTGISIGMEGDCINYVPKKLDFSNNSSVIMNCYETKPSEICS